MDTVIQFTPAQLIALASAIVVISTACGVIVNIINKAREPERRLPRKTNGQNEYVAFTKELPVAPTTDGNYRLKLTVSGGTPSLSWEEIT